MRILLDPLLRFNSLVGSTAQCERSNAPVAQFCQSIGCSPMFSPRGVLERDLWGRRTGSPSYSAYDGLPVRRPRRSKRKLAAKPQATAFLRVQTSDSTKDSIEIKLPEAGERLEAIGVREQTLTTHHLPHMPPSGLNPNSRIICKIHYRAGSLREIHYVRARRPTLLLLWAIRMPGRCGYWFASLLALSPEGRHTGFTTPLMVIP